MKTTKIAFLGIGICCLACNAVDRSTQDRREHERSSTRVKKQNDAHSSAKASGAEPQPSTPPLADERREDRRSTPTKEMSDTPLADGHDASEAASPSDPVRVLALSGHNSIYQVLLGTNTLSVAIFSDDDGIIALDDRGSRVRISDEPFRQIAIDYDLGILWLDRVSAADAGDPGLFIMDIFGSDLSLTKVTRLTRGFEIVGLDGSPLLITQGHRPYRVIMDANEKIQIQIRADSPVACGDECNPSAESISVVSAAIRRRLNSTVPTLRVELLPVSAGNKEATFKDGDVLDIPGFSLVLRYVRRSGNHGFGWQLYDNETKEYISSSTFVRSKEPWPEEVNHLMVCDGGRLLVVERACFDSKLQRLDAGNNHTHGVCLSGGILFQNRTGFTFLDQVN